MLALCNRLMGEHLHVIDLPYRQFELNITTIQHPPELEDAELL